MPLDDRIGLRSVCCIHSTLCAINHNVTQCQRGRRIDEFDHIAAEPIAVQCLSAKVPSFRPCDLIKTRKTNILDILFVCKLVCLFNRLYSSRFAQSVIIICAMLLVEINGSFRGGRVTCLRALSVCRKSSGRKQVMSMMTVKILVIILFFITYLSLLS